MKAIIPGLECEVGFILFVNDGLLAVLEGHTYGEPWPEVIDRFELAYTDPDRSDLRRQLDATSSGRRT